MTEELYLDAHAWEAGDGLSLCVGVIPGYAGICVYALRQGTPYQVQVLATGLDDLAAASFKALVSRMNAHRFRVAQLLALTQDTACDAVRH